MTPALALAAALAAGALAAGSPPSFSKEELASLYYADLGPAEIEVADYPKKQRENYALFRRVCAQCHTLARAVNSPTISQGAWDYYVFKMRLRSKFSPGTGYTPEEGRAVVDFLVHDARARKEKRREEFDTLTRKLQNRFGETIAERMRRLQEASPRVNP